METDLNIKWKRNIKTVKEEMYNLKNIACQKIFKDHTNNTHMAQIFESDKHLDLLTKKFLNSLNGAVIKCLKKVRKN